MTEGNSTPEFSFEVDLTALSSRPKHYKLKVEPVDYERLAERLGILALHSCEGEINIAVTRKVIQVSGKVSGAALRECVASLEEMKEEVSDSFELEFLRHSSPESDDKPVDVSALIEVHEGDILDIGELLIQQFSLAMTPFPRKDGASSLAVDYGKGGDVSPFANLHEILKKDH